MFRFIVILPFLCLIFQKRSELFPAHSVSVESLHKLLEAHNLTVAHRRVHGNEVVQVVLGLRRLDAPVARRRLHPAPVRLLHVSPVRGKLLEECRRGHHPEEPVVLGVQDRVRPERLRHVLVKVGREGQVGVQVEHQRPLVGLVEEEYVVVPYDQLLLVLAGLLAPERHHLLLVGHEDHEALGELGRRGLTNVSAQLPHVFLAEAWSVGAVGRGGEHGIGGGFAGGGGGG